jgi:hypothetical protein
VLGFTALELPVARLTKGEVVTEVSDTIPFGGGKEYNRETEDGEGVEENT